MEDGENGAQFLWNGYIREKSMTFRGNFQQKNEKVLEMGRPKSKSSSDYCALQHFLRSRDLERSCNPKPC